MGLCSNGNIARCALCWHISDILSRVECYSFFQTIMSSNTGWLLGRCWVSTCVDGYPILWTKLIAFPLCLIFLKAWALHGSSNFLLNSLFLLVAWYMLLSKDWPFPLSQYSPIHLIANCILHFIYSRHFRAGFFFIFVRTLCSGFHLLTSYLVSLLSIFPSYHMLKGTYPNSKQIKYLC